MLLPSFLSLSARVCLLCALCSASLLSSPLLPSAFCLLPPATCHAFSAKVLYILLLLSNLHIPLLLCELGILLSARTSYPSSTLSIKTEWKGLTAVRYSVIRKHLTKLTPHSISLRDQSRGINPSAHFFNCIFLSPAHPAPAHPQPPGQGQASKCRARPAMTCGRRL